VLLPVLSPLSWKHSDDAVRLGRSTEWQDHAGQSIPLGQKLFLVDDEELPILEIRHIEFSAAQAAP
jgi:type VI secretion system protein ImpE